MNQKEDIQQALVEIEQSNLFLSSRWFAKEYFKDANKNDVPDSAERRVRLEKKILTEYAEVLNPSKSFLDRLKAFLGASSKAGRKAKAVKDFALLFTPYGKQIGTVTEFVSERFIKPEQSEDHNMKNIIKRAFTSDGGGFFRVRDEDGKISGTAIGATAIRLALILGVGYAAKLLGIPISKLLAVLGI